MRKTLSREHWPLVSSGLAAIAIVAWILWRETGDVLLLLVNLAFAFLFLTTALDDALRLPAVYGRFAMPLMLILNLLAVLRFPYQVTLILSVVLAASLPYQLPARWSWGLIAAANLLFALMISERGMSGGDLAGLMTLIALQVFAISSSLARRREEESRLVLTQRNRELQAARAVLAQQSLAEERLRIAGELHDTIGHGLTALQLQLEALSHEAPDYLRKSVLNCKSLAADLLEDVRAIVRAMPDAAATDLSAALRDLAALMPDVELEVADGLPDVDSALAQQLAYCFREGIHNAVRHGRADRIAVDYVDGQFRVTDNGTGLRGQTPGRGFGLDNMQQRLAPFGGSVSLEPAPRDRGCVLLLSFPKGAST